MPLLSEQSVRRPGKKAGVRWQAGGSIFLPSLSRLPTILIVGGQVAYFLGNAKSMSPSGLSDSSFRNSLYNIRVQTKLDR